MKQWSRSLLRSQDTESDQAVLIKEEVGKLASSVLKKKPSECIESERLVLISDNTGNRINMYFVLDDLGTAPLPEFRNICKKIPESKVWNLDFITQAYEQGRDTCSSDFLVSFIRQLKQMMQSHAYMILNKIISGMNYSEVCPEIIVASLRVTSPVKPLLSDWKPALERARHELESRKLDVTNILIGLS